MTKSVIALTALVAGSAFAGTSAPAPVAADKPAFTGSLAVGYANEYIFRGAEYGDDLVEACLTLGTEWKGVTLTGCAWYGSVGSSRLLQGAADAPSHYDELDLSIEAAKDLGFATAKIGYVWRHYDALKFTQAPDFNEYKTIDDQQEIYFGLSRDLAYGINASLTYFWDIEYDLSGYTELGFKKTFELCPKTSLELASTTGYLMEEDQLTHTQLLASLNYKLTENATLTPYVGVSIELDEADNAYANFNVPGTLGLDNTQGNQLFGGVKLSVAF